MMYQIRLACMRLSRKALNFQGSRTLYFVSVAIVDKLVGEKKQIERETVRGRESNAFSAGPGDLFKAHGFKLNPGTNFNDRASRELLSSKTALQRRLAVLSNLDRLTGKKARIKRARHAAAHLINKRNSIQLCISARQPFFSSNFPLNWAKGFPHISTLSLASALSSERQSSRTLNVRECRQSIPILKPHGLPCSHSPGSLLTHF